MSPLTAANPARSAAPLPPLCGCSSSVNPSSRCSACRLSRVPSVEQSSTTMSSSRSGTASTRRMISSIVSRSLNAGMTTDSSGSASGGSRRRVMASPVPVRMALMPGPRVPTIESRSGNRGVQPSSRRALSAVGVQHRGIARPARRRASTAPAGRSHARPASMTSRTECGTPGAEIVGGRPPRPPPPRRARARARRPDRSRGHSRAGTCRRASGSRRRTPGAPRPPVAASIARGIRWISGA